MTALQELAAIEDEVVNLQLRMTAVIDMVHEARILAQREIEREHDDPRQLSMEMAA